LLKDKQELTKFLADKELYLGAVEVFESKIKSTNIKSKVATIVEVKINILTVKA
jgi:hypothetical protein